MNIVNYLLSCKCGDNFKDWSLLILRVIVGLMFAAHGWQKVQQGIPGVTSFFGSAGIPFPMFFAYLITYLELIGGVALAAGLFTHWLSKLFAIEMLVAFFTVHLERGIFVSKGGFEFVAVIFGVAIVLMTFGAGKFALDDYLKKGK